MSNTNNNEKEPKRCVQLVFSYFFFVFFKINYCFIDSNNEMHYREASHKKKGPNDVNDGDIDNVHSASPYKLHPLHLAFITTTLETMKALSTTLV